jgi:hypothetical protein
MRKLKNIMLLTATFMMLCACPKEKNGHYYISVVNQSDKTIKWQRRLFKNNETDTLYNCQYIGFIVLPDSIYLYSSGRNTWETELNTSSYLQLILVDNDAYIQYRTAPCDTIRKYVPILHIYQLTLEDLQRVNWTVTYPPE